MKHQPQKDRAQRLEEVADCLSESRSSVPAPLLDRPAYGRARQPWVGDLPPLGNRAGESSSVALTMTPRSRKLRAVILKASDEGLSKALIARLTGRSRQTIHRDLERAQRERG
jgi:DNA-directed RNA polymerase specialized sigma24 family protein